MAHPVDRFAPSQDRRDDEDLLPLRLPAQLTTVEPTTTLEPSTAAAAPHPDQADRCGS